MPRIPLPLLLAALAGCLPHPPSSPAPAARPLVIAHRGASMHLPEHTLEAYALAIAVGADYIEPDLVVTRDGALVARHENEIGRSTDVAARPEFASRRTEKWIDGNAVAGWFAEDFTLEELRTLRAREPNPEMRPASAAHDGRYAVPTLDEVLDLAVREGRSLGRPIGVYIETKHPTYFDSIGLPLEPRIVAALERVGWNRADAPVFIQSFETANLRRLHATSRVPLVQLLSATGAPYDVVRAGGSLTYADMATAAGLSEIAGYATGVGPAKALVLPRDPAGEWGAPTRLVADAHAAGLVVHPWTFRSENQFLPPALRRGDPGDARFPHLPGDAAAEYLRFLELGVDGFFTDDPAAAVEALGRRR
jgi:glycerophosphoryl diester phosphodiesterase